MARSGLVAAAERLAIIDFMAQAMGIGQRDRLLRQPSPATGSHPRVADRARGNPFVPVFARAGRDFRRISSTDRSALRDPLRPQASEPERMGNIHLPSHRSKPPLTP